MSIIKPDTLRDEFNQLFEKHKEIENNPKFKALKEKYSHLNNLEPKHDINTLSEIFQDPDLVARISSEAHEIMRVGCVRPSRVRSQSDIIISKKPQAKDVYRQALIDEDIAHLYQSAEKTIDSDAQYVNPITPKQRIYLAQEKESVNATQPQPQQPHLPLSSSVIPTPQFTPDDAVFSVAQEAIASLTQKTPRMPLISLNEKPTETSDELERMFEQVANEISQSPLQTVRSKHLYNFLPRQSDLIAYNYVKEDFNPNENNQKKSRDKAKETLITLIIHKASSPSVKSQEIECLGSQSLTDVRDAIFCLSDFEWHQARMNAECADTTSQENNMNGACMIYLDHVFYLDTRYPNHPSYETWIDHWLTKKKVDRQKFQYTTALMQETILGQMKLKLNTPIALIHQEQCEHMLLIPDIRLLSDNEYKSIDEFPRTTHNFTYIRFKCSMCSVYPATKLTHDDIISGFSPCYFCDICFDSFHQNDGVKPVVYHGQPGGQQSPFHQIAANKKL
ncbi:snRNA-activating protein of 50kDa MW C terminal-domain-containing protein [Choanephora cucurbitarum]|nr:snRNA-activating protein of 50kDa MW C terminal-domain-containing protein [Choanephora cucurbitarum]